MDRLDFGDDKADSASGLGAPVVFVPSGWQTSFAESGEMGGTQNTVSDRKGPDSKRSEKVREIGDLAVGSDNSFSLFLSAFAGSEGQS
jgi:hypothetical protein